MNEIKPKDGDFRMTVQCLSAGQPRAYADHIYTYNVYFEWIPYDIRILPENKKWEPCHYNEEIIKKYLQAIKHWKEGERHWTDSKLEYINNLSPGLWQFQVTEAYTD